MKPLEDLFDENAMDTGFIDIDKVISKERFIKVVEERIREKLIAFIKFQSLEDIYDETYIDLFIIDQSLKERKEADK